MIVKNTVKILAQSTLLILCACSGAGTDSENLKSISVQELKEKVNTNSKLVESFEGTGSIAFESPKESNAGFIEVHVKKPDSIYVKIEGPFGIDIATALITRDEFLYYNAQENKAITGPTNELNIGAILKIRMGFEELLNSITATFVFSEGDGDTADAGTKGKYYLLSVEGAEFFIEPYAYSVHKYVNHEFEVRYSKFNRVTSARLPGQITIERPKEKQTVWIGYDSMTINKKNLSFKIKIPKSAKMIRWE